MTSSISQLPDVAWEKQFQDTIADERHIEQKYGCIRNLWMKEVVVGIQCEKKCLSVVCVIWEFIEYLCYPVYRTHLPFEILIYTTQKFYINKLIFSEINRIQFFKILYSPAILLRVLCFVFVWKLLSPLNPFFQFLAQKSCKSFIVTPK